MGTQLNQSWPRWVFASVSSHFNQHRQGLPMFIEGQHRNTRNMKDFIELRMDGPQFTEVNRGEWRIYFEVNILIQSTMDNENYHRIHTNVGIVAAAFTDIVMFKYGNQPGDDNSVWECAKILQDVGKRQHIDIFHFGQIDTQTKLVQSTVEGHYEGYAKGV
jgi:hypothetical protein